MTDLTTSEPSVRLNLAIEHLYQVFAGYPPYLEGCPCCVTEEMKEPLRTIPLRELTSSDLVRFHYKVITTWSDEDGFRNFLPRMLELIVTDEEYSLDLCIITQKLFDAEWLKWSTTEKEAIIGYLLALWDQQIQIYPVFPLLVDDVLSMIFDLVEDISPCLQRWSDEKSGTGALHLAQFVFLNTQSLLRSPPVLPSTSYINDGQDQRSSDQIIRWLLEPERLACLRMLQDHPPQVPLEFDLEKAIQTLEILQGERERLSTE